MMQLRDYQQAAIDSIFNFWSTGKKRPLIVAPTGAGKSLIIAGFCKQILQEYPDIRIMVVTDSKELIEQNAAELKKHWLEASVGIYSAGVGKRQTDAKITFAGIQTIYKHMMEFYPAIDIVIIDEAHMIPRDGDTRYGEFIKAILLCNPKAAFIGLTATPYRLDSGMLHTGESALFDGISYSVDMLKLISAGYLVPVISKGGLKSIDLSKVHMVAGEYNQGELACAADDPALVEAAVEEIKRYGADRKSWLIFATGVDHARHISDLIPGSEVVTGDTPKAERADLISRFRSGKLRCLVNIGVLTKGFNAPCLDLIALLTATKSTGKYVQMVGRGLRPCTGKTNCLLLDFGGNVLEHGPIDDVRPRRPKSGGGADQDAPAKQCPQCQALIHARVRECPDCGYQYPEDMICNHSQVAYSGAVLSSQEEPVWVPVTRVGYSRHSKDGSPDSVKVTYFAGAGKQYPVWVCLDHTGYAAKKALKHVIEAGGEATTTTDALEEAWDHWATPTRIKVRRNGKFFDVLDIQYAPIVKEQRSL